MTCFDTRSGRVVGLFIVFVFTGRVRQKLTMGRCNIQNVATCRRRREARLPVAAPGDSMRPSDLDCWFLLCTSMGLIVGGKPCYAWQVLQLVSDFIWRRMVDPWHVG